MKKIKLPRKRKKAFIKAHSWIDYVSWTIINEVLSEERGATNYHRSYYDLKMKGTKAIPIKKW